MVTVQTRPKNSNPFDAYLNNYKPFRSDLRLYWALRKGIPMLNGMICRLIELYGQVRVKCKDEGAEKYLNDFLESIQINKSEKGFDNFMKQFIDKELQYGFAVGEIVLTQDKHIHSLLTFDHDDMPTFRWKQVDKDNPLSLSFHQQQPGKMELIPLNESLMIYSANSGTLSNPYGVSSYDSLPFVSNIILQIFNSTGLNWERFGNLTYSVTYKPEKDNMDKKKVEERIEIIQDSFAKAMEKKAYGEAADFYGVGDISVKVIGADNQILDMDVPARVLTEQIISDAGIPPFILGLSWSTTERMSQKQTEIFAARLDDDRKQWNHVAREVINLHQALEGLNIPYDLEWSSVSLDDALDKARVRQINAVAEKSEIDNAVRKRNENIIDQQQAAEELGYEKPAGDPPEVPSSPLPDNNVALAAKKGIISKNAEVDRRIRVARAYKRKALELEGRYYELVQSELESLGKGVLKLFGLDKIKTVKESPNLTPDQLEKLRELLNGFTDNCIEKGGNVYPSVSYTLGVEGFCRIMGIDPAQYAEFGISTVNQLTQENLDLFTKYSQEIKSGIMDILKKGAEAGEQPDKLAEQIQNLFGKMVKRAKTLAREEIAKAQYAAHKELADANDVYGYLYNAAPDACPICQEIDGTISRTPFIRQHIGCRCYANVPLTRDMFDELKAEGYPVAA